MSHPKKARLSWMTRARRRTRESHAEAIGEGARFNILARARPPVIFPEPYFSTLFTPNETSRRVRPFAGSGLRLLP